MTQRLPNTRGLAKRISSTKIGRGESVGSSVVYLAKHAAELKSFASVEDLAIADAVSGSTVAHPLVHHLTVVRAALARELWSRQVFIGVSVLDDLVFHAAARGDGDLVVSILAIIRDRKLHKPGLIVYPVHSFGVLAAGLLHSFTHIRIRYMASEFGIALTPQTNSIEGTLQFLDDARTAFGVSKRVPNDLLKHWIRSRNAEWLFRNPLLAVRVRSLPGQYYENQFLLIGKLQMATALVAMFASLQPAVRDGHTKMFSSSAINNFQTLDIHHYIALFDAPVSSRLQGDCVPMNASPAVLSEISDLGVELDPRTWNRRPGQARAIHAALDTVYEGYLRYSVGRDGRTTPARVYRKMFESLAYFRRSFQASSGDWKPIISLAIAFEMLLTDHYALGIPDRVARRVQLLLKGTAGVRTHVQTIEDLFGARGQLVHAGATDEVVDLQNAQRVFTLTFTRLAGRLSGLSGAPVNAPVAHLTGDTKA